MNESMESALQVSFGSINGGGVLQRRCSRGRWVAKEPWRALAPGQCLHGEQTGGWSLERLLRRKMRLRQEGYSGCVRWESQMIHSLTCLHFISHLLPERL